MEKFDIVNEGYDVKQVSDFIDDVILKLQNYIVELSKKDSQIKLLQDKLEKYDNTKETIDNTLISVQDASNKIISLARQEAEEIIRTAKQTASSITDEALKNANLIELESSTLKNNVRLFKNKMKVFIEGQLDMVDEIDKENF